MSAGAGAPVVEARDVRFSYGATEVLKGISLGIARHAVTAIIGPSGCGKSTFLRAINRMHELLPDVRHSGELFLDGASIYGAGRDLVDLRRRIGMVFQRPNPFPKSIYDTVAYGPTVNRLVLPRDLPDLVERSLRQAALWDEVKDRLHEPGTTLSGGQQQRLGIARLASVRRRAHVSQGRQRRRSLDESTPRDPRHALPPVQRRHASTGTVRQTDDMSVATSGRFNQFVMARPPSRVLSEPEQE